jgi:hypothetical protein
MKWLRRSVWLALAVLLAAGPAVPQTGSRYAPRPVPVAETRLLMEGINLPNYNGLERLLRERPADAEAWTFIRGQALLIAENGNLLLLRPPRTQGRDLWMDRAAELRTMAVRLARDAARQDYDHTRRDLILLADSCNRCHQSFRVATRLTPFKKQPVGPKESVP